MSVNEWKILNQIKCYMSKLNEKLRHKEFADILQKIPSLSNGQLFRYSMHETEQQQPAENMEQKKVKKTYHLPNMLDGLKIKVNQTKNEVLLEPATKWKSPPSVVSKVDIHLFSRATSQCLVWLYFMVHYSL